MKLEQIFYGNIGSGYKILGASDATLADKAAELCRAVGTPDGLSEVAPFLMSVPVGEHLLMICCTPGRADGIGRKTLFFHIIVADKAEASHNGINAFSLREAKCFVESFPLGGASALSVNRLEYVAEPSTWNGAFARLSRKRPANSEIRGMLGYRVNDCAWATFSFCNLGEPFKLYAVSEHAPMPIPDSPVQGFKPAEGNPAKKSSSHAGILSVLLALSLVTNVWLWSSSAQDEQEGGNSNRPPEISTTNNAGRLGKKSEESIESRLAKAREEGQKSALKELANAFPKENRIQSVEDEMPGPFRNPKYVGFVQKLKAYVSFVNSKILVEEEK